MPMQPNYSSRRDFLKKSALTGVAASMTGALAGCASQGGAGAVTLPSGVTLDARIGETRPRPAGQKPVHQLTTAPQARVRAAFIGCGGRGTSLIGDQRLAWGPKDIFVAPSWTFQEHEASEDAVIFTFSDRVVQEKLGFFREQRGNA